LPAWALWVLWAGFFAAMRRSPPSSHAAAARR
jgi:hypothetical protein